MTQQTAPTCHIQHHKELSHLRDESPWNRNPKKVHPDLSSQRETNREIPFVPNYSHIPEAGKVERTHDRNPQATRQTRYAGKPSQLPQNRYQCQSALTSSSSLVTSELSKRFPLLPPPYPSVAPHCASPLGVRVEADPRGSVHDERRTPQAEEGRDGTKGRGRSRGLTDKLKIKMGNEILALMVVCRKTDRNTNPACQK
ncbi:hypothetical protein VTJ04DRAFT_1729 [Mycothermus thermophilus]|uniref:uncharacterized protein n=1 Tax=Humicola insolens TaxID=85995 RepID=UPI0037448D27